MAQANRRGAGHLNVAMVSRLPFTSVVHHDEPDRVTHAMVEARVEWGGQLLTIWGAHLTASSEERRLKQVEYLRERVDRARVCSERMLLMGDLNSLSAGDPYEGLEGRLRDCLERKFAGAEERDGWIRFDVTDALRELAWVDLRDGSTPWQTSPRKYGEVRIDYILASPSMATLLASTSVIENPPLGVDPHCAKQHGPSDHRPVVATFRLPD